MDSHLTLTERVVKPLREEYTMVEQEIELATADGSADAVLFTPHADADVPGVLHIPDIRSIRESHRAMARRLASEGYTVLMPNPFYRTGKSPVMAPEIKHGSPEFMKRMQ